MRGVRTRALAAARVIRQLVAALAAATVQRVAVVAAARAEVVGDLALLAAILVGTERHRSASRGQLQVLQLSAAAGGIAAPLRSPRSLRCSVAHRAAFPYQQPSSRRAIRATQPSYLLHLAEDTDTMLRRRWRLWRELAQSVGKAQPTIRRNFYLQQRAPEKTKRVISGDYKREAL